MLPESFLQLRRHIPDARLTIVGCKPAIRQYDGVTVLGMLRKDVPAEASVLDSCYRAATIFCMPSLFETTGMVYLEAQLYGLPVVMFAEDGRTEEVFPPYTAVLLKERTSEAVTAALLELARMPRRAAVMGRRGRENVLARYTWPRVARRMWEEIEGTQMGIALS